MGCNDIKHYDTQQSGTQNNGINHDTRPMSSTPTKHFIKLTIDVFSMLIVKWSPSHQKKSYVSWKNND